MPLRASGRRGGGLRLARRLGRGAASTTSVFLVSGSLFLFAYAVRVSPGEAVHRTDAGSGVGGGRPSRRRTPALRGARVLLHARPSAPVGERHFGVIATLHVRRPGETMLR